MTDLGGFAEPGYGPVADALASTFEHGDLGAGCALYVDGKAVVDLWGGVADKATGRPWDRDTLTLVFSVGKGVSSICAQMLVETGRARPRCARHDLLARVRRRGQGGHDRPRRAQPPDRPARGRRPGDAWRTCATPPAWRPAWPPRHRCSSPGRRTPTRRSRSVGPSARSSVASPARPWAHSSPASSPGRSGLDLYIGLPPELEARVSTIEPPDAPPELVALVLPEGQPALARHHAQRLDAGDDGRQRDSGSTRPRCTNSNCRRPTASPTPGRWPASTPPPSARWTASGCCSPRRVAAASVVRSEGKPWGEPFDGPTWATGFLRPFPRQPMLGGASFGHDGAGGSIAFAEPDLGLGVQPRHQPDDRHTGAGPAHRRVAGRRAGVHRRLNGAPTGAPTIDLTYPDELRHLGL